MLILLPLVVTAIGVIPDRVVTVGLLCIIVFGIVLTVVAVVVAVACVADVVVAGRTFVIPSLKTHPTVLKHFYKPVIK